MLAELEAEEEAEAAAAAAAAASSSSAAGSGTGRQQQQQQQPRTASTTSQRSSAHSHDVSPRNARNHDAEHNAEDDEDGEEYDDLVKMAGADDPDAALVGLSLEQLLAMEKEDWGDNGAPKGLL